MTRGRFKTPAEAFEPHLRAWLIQRSYPLIASKDRRYPDYGARAGPAFLI